MLRPALCTTRSAVRLLADSKPSQKFNLPNVRSLHHYPLVRDPSLLSRNPVPAALVTASVSRLSTQRSVEGLRSRPFASVSKNSTRNLRSDGRHRRAAVDRPLVSMTEDDLPRKDRKANPFLPFQASSFVDAFVTTIVGVGLSES